MVHLRPEGTVAQFCPRPVFPVPLVPLLHAAKVLQSSVVNASLQRSALQAGLALAPAHAQFRLLLLPEDDVMLLLGAEQLEQLEGGVEELSAGQAHVHLHHFVEDGREGLELARLEGRKAEVDIEAGKFLVRRRSQLSEDLVDPLFLHVRDQVVGVLQGLYLSPLLLRLGLGLLHGLAVEVLSDGQLLGVAVLWPSAGVRQAGVGGVRAAEVHLLLLLLLALQAGDGLLALHDLAGDLVDGGLEGHLHEVVLPLLFFLLLELPVVVVEPLEALALALLPAVGETAINDLPVYLLADGVDLGLEGAFPHHFLFFLLLLPEQGRLLLLGPSVPLLDYVILAQLVTYFLTDPVDLGLVFLVLHQVVLAQRILLRVLMGIS